MGTWANGWDYGTYANSYVQHTLTSYIKDDSGKFIFNVFGPAIEKKILFMRKLVAEKLIDVECFNQNDSKSKEKMAAGKVAIIGSHYPTMKSNLDQTLYKTHPEMQYVPIGPILDYDGKNLTNDSIQLDGRAGTPILCLTSSCKNPQAAIDFINFNNTDEGVKLASYGIEGTHYTLNANGQPRLTADWLAKWKADPKSLRNEGVQSVYTWQIALDTRVSKFGSSNPGDEDIKDSYYEAAKAMSPLDFRKGFRLSYFNTQYPGYDKIDSLTNAATTKDNIEKAYFAKSDAEALKILNDYRTQLEKAGIHDLEKFINEKAATRDDIIW